MNLIFHIDVNSAFLSWTAIERLQKDPSLDIRTIPAIIGGDEKSRHGVVLAKSISAKKYGIRTGEPVATALRKCPFLHMEPPDHQLYRRRSQELMDLLHTYTSDIEQVSIDECYLDFTPICHLFKESSLRPRGSSNADQVPLVHSECPFFEPDDSVSNNFCGVPSGNDRSGNSIQTARFAARLIADRIRNELGFTVNIGIAPNKLLAKMASDFEKPDKVHTLFPEEIPTKMWPLPVSELYMVGHSSADRLVQLGIRTIGELANTDPEFLQQHFKSHGKLMWEYANGISNAPLNPDNHEAKGIGNSTTLASDVTTAPDAKKVLLALAEQVASRLRQAHQLAQTVTVEIKYNTFRSCSRQTQLSIPAATSGTLYDCACRLFDELWDGTPIRLLGIRTSKLVPEDTPVQLSLFDELFTANVSTISNNNISSNTFSVRTAQANDFSSGNHLSAAPSYSHSFLEKQKRLEQAMDQIRERYGKNSVIRGSFLKSQCTDSDKTDEN